MRAAFGCLATSVLLTALAHAPATGQNGPATPNWAQPVELEEAVVPFEVGERLEYKVKLGWFNAGEGSLEVAAIDTVRGSPSYHAIMRIDGGIAFAKVHDQFETWFDTRTLVSHRFIQDQNEVGSQRYRHYEMYPERGTWEREDDTEIGDLPTQLPLDDIAFIYFIRTLPLEVGETYTFDRYFKETGNPVVIKVLRKEEKKVPAGTFQTIVVQPIIRTKGIFGEGGKAELYFSDDERRALIYMKSSVPVVGSLTLHLTSPPVWQSETPTPAEDDGAGEPDKKTGN